MWWWRKKRKKEEPYVSIWKDDFSDCITADYLPDYSVCQCENNKSCRHIATYAGMTLCSNPDHKSFIPEGAERFDPYKKQYGG